jgi:hypothetical protein
VPIKLLDACVNGLSALARRSPRSPQVTEAWYQVTETAIKKAARKPDEAEAVSDWLRKRVDQLRSSGMKDTETLERLNALTNSLK